MEKQSFPKICALFSAGILLFATMLPKTSTATEDTGSISYKCPSGDTYLCFKVGESVIAYKGKGETIVTVD